MAFYDRLYPALLITGLSFLSASLYAAQPKFTFAPLTPTTVQGTTDDPITVQYSVTNQTDVTRTLTMRPIVGVTQVTTGQNACATPFTLAPHESCTLTIEIPAGVVPPRVLGGPEVCKTISEQNTQPDPLLCSQPSAVDTLNITRNSARAGRIAINPSTLTLTTGSSTSGQITVANLSYSASLSNVQAFFNGTALANNVTQNSSDCTTIAPRSSCTLTFTPKSTAVSPTTFVIRGSNTRPVGATMSVVSPTAANITLTGSPLILTAGNPGSSGNLLVTNTSSILTATNIVVDLTNLPGVTQNASSCQSVLPGATCSITLTAGSSSISTTNAIVQGNNTSQTTASIAVNPTTPSITISAGSPLTLIANGTSTGTMTIQNNGTAAATNVTALFEGTLLNGNVTASTCSSISPNTSCDITFTAGTTVVSATTFPISGSNTSTLTGTLTLSPLPRMYLASGYQSTDALTVCQISTTGSTVGNPTNCIDTGVSASLLSNPMGVTFNAAQTYLYAVNSTSNSITQCQVDTSTGALSTCMNFTDTNFNNPNSIAVTSTHAYITNLNNASVTQCDINASGEITPPCTNYTSTLFLSPTGISVNTAANVIYIANSGKTTLSTCPITPSGITTSDCVSTALPAGTVPQGIVMYPNGQWLYTVDSNYSDIYLCSIVSAGALGSCSSVYAAYPTLFRSFGLALNSAGTTLYVTNTQTTSGSVVQLSVNSSTGALKYVTNNFNISNMAGVALLAD